ncbi:TetR/AcrR family transcriptional regulator [Actinomycetospora sp. CA-101289]|uniref:TetR/AcrR family transcriptional regulator n=1 Tax=Actinomycetospora sp. CA-101289 TaxID=3239893 RepID=UPI003D99C0E1
MSPRSADPTVRTALLEAAARLVAAEGPRALSTRRLAAEVGTSTMAVYTHFGSMDEVRRAVRQDGFARLEADLDAVPRTEDPVADLAAAAAAYFATGLAHPERYRAMFVDRPPAEEDDPGAEVFTRLVDAVRRCLEAGRFPGTDAGTALRWAAEIWTMVHGMVTLAHSRLLPPEQVWSLLTDMTYRLVVGFGDDPAAAESSVEHGYGSRVSR